MIPTSSSSSSSILRKVPSFLRSPILSPTPPSSIRRFRLVQFCPNFSIRNSISISGRVIGGKGFPVSGSRVRQMGMDYTRISAVSDSGSGGIGGSDGGGSGGSGGDGGGGDGGSNPRWSLLSWYLDLLARFPVLTKAVTSGLLTLIGDVVCQLVIDQVPSLDLKRTFVFSFVGLALVGPTLHFWYLFLSKLVTFPGSSGAFLRLLLDQFVFSPVFIGVVLASLVTLEGHPSRVVPKLQQEWFSAVIANWQLWIPFQFLNFRFVPQQFQVLAANFMALIWNVILSYKAHKEIRPQ